MAGCLLLIAIGIGSRILWVVCGGNDVTLYSLTVFRLDTLAAGGWIALACRGSLGIAPLVRPARVTFAACSVLLLLLTFADRRLLTLKDTLWTLELSSFLVLMVWASRGSVFRWLGTAQPLKLLGKYSYGIYVYSHLLIWVVAPWLTAPGMVEFCGSPLLGQAAYLAAMAALTISTAVVSWRFFEMPFLSFKRYFPT